MMNILNEFSSIFSSTKSTRESVNSEITTTRASARSVHRANITFNTAEEYYRMSTYLPVLNDFSAQLREKFQNHRNVICSLSKILPKHCINAQFSDIEDCVLFYFGEEVENETTMSEFNVCQVKSVQIPAWERPSSALLSLVLYNKHFFSNHTIPSQSLGDTIPVSTATPERTFLTLKRLKTYLRNTTGQERSTGLALVSVYRDIDIDTQKVIDGLAK